MRSSLLWPQLVTQLACDSLTSIVAMAVRDGAEPCCYGNVPVRELSGFVGSKRLRGMFVWHCFSSNVRVCLRVFACLCLTVRCPRAAVMSASVRDTPSAPPLFLGFRGARHSNHILCWLTTPLLPWLLAKLLPGWPADASELLGSNWWTSHPSDDTVFMNSASPPLMLGQHKDRHIGAQRWFEDYFMHG